MNNRIIAYATVFVVLQAVPGCIVTKPAVIERNTEAVETSTATLERSDSHIRENTEAVQDNAEEIHDSSRSILENTGVLRISADEVRRNTEAMRETSRELHESVEATRGVADLLARNIGAIDESRTAIEANNEAIGRISKAFDSDDGVEGLLEHLGIDEILDELRFSLVVAFLAFGYVVTTVGNDARARCEELLLGHLRAGPDARMTLAIQQSADDFENTYRWYFRLAVLIVAYFVVRLVLFHGGWWYAVYAGGVTVSAWVLCRFHRNESRHLAEVSAGRLRLARSFGRLIGSNRHAKLEPGAQVPVPYADA